VFIDSEADTWNMDPALLEEAILDQRQKGKNISAIIVVHLYGMPAKMNEILRVAERYSIPVIEDAAEALGSTYEGRACGSMGDVGILSFNGNKIITTSGGGALASNNDTLVSRVRHLSAQAKEPAPYYLHNDIGYNYRLSNICAAIGRGQMEVLPERVSRRRAVFARYQEALGSLPGVHFLQEPGEAFHSNRWLTTVLLDAAVFGDDMPEKIRVALETKDIESRPLWKPLHQQPVFENCPYYGQGVSDRLFSTGLCLPSGSNMTDETLAEVITLLQSLLVGQSAMVG
jgi:dTDP-4-amino-4,6-dideoxygalactose transaminase